MTEAEAIAYIHSFVNYEDPAARKRGPGFTLAGMRCLLDALGRPEERYPSVIVAGSKGKGSTSAMLASILRAAGHRTGLYTQPHLHSWRERLRVDGEPLAVESLLRQVQRLQALVPTLPERCPEIARPTAYELGTAVALLECADQVVDLAVLEIGLGGRLDAVNTVTPCLSVIAPISLEHTDVLGSTLAAIAGEKAGIIKPGVPVVLAPQPPEAAAVFEAVAHERGAPLYWAADLVTGEPTAGQAPHEAAARALSGIQQVTLSASDPAGPSGVVSLPLLGAHQRRNAMTALAAALLLQRQGWRLGGPAMRAGLAATRWPGRLEVLQAAPLLLVDGAHNPESAERLRDALAEHFPGRRITFVLGILADKDIDGIVAALAPRASRLIVTAPRQARSAPVERLAQAAAAAGIVAEVRVPVAEAIRLALAGTGVEDIICVAGSLMTVAEAREAVGRCDA